MRHLDLFSGIGGFALACTWVWGEKYENVGHSEIEPYPCKVYHRHFPESECLGDITKIKWREGQADLITGGFPCQPHSVAGKRKGSEDERDLWAECVRALRGVRPRYAVFENVPGLLTSDRGRFFNRVLRDIHESGYDAEWQIVSAQEVGAPHKRERIWIVAYPAGGRSGSESRNSLHKGRRTSEAGGTGLPQTTGRPDGIAIGHAQPTSENGTLARPARLLEGRQDERPERERVGLHGQQAGIVADSVGDGSQGIGNHGNSERSPGLCGGERKNEIEKLSDTESGERNGAERTRSGRARLTDRGSFPDWSGGGVGQPWPVTREDGSEPMGDSERSGRGGKSRRRTGQEPANGCSRNEREIERDFRGVPNGTSNRVDRLKALGNAIVPQCAAVILRAIKAHNEQL